MKNKMEADLTEINKLLLLQSKIRTDASGNKKWAYDLSIENFSKATACLNPQSYGSRIETRLISELAFSKSDIDRGDTLHINGKFIEIKGSIITNINPSINLVQIRPWQEIDYLIYCFDVRDICNVKINYFYLSKIQMNNEIITCKAQSAHGTKKSNQNNINKELAIRFEKDGSIFDRWVIEYSSTLDHLKK